MTERFSNYELDDITIELFSNNLDTFDLPDPDLVIRTSGEKRTSNFLPWQCAYSEYVFEESNWPDFNKEIYEEILKEVGEPNIELVLSKVRGLSEVVGSTKVYGLDAAGHKGLSKTICDEIKDVVGVDLPEGENPFSDIISWANGITRKEAVEIFTTNYDLLFEDAMERVKTPYFDGFVGATITTAKFFRCPMLITHSSPDGYIATSSCGASLATSLFRWSILDLQ